MRLNFSRKQRPHTIYIQRSFRDKNGKSTTVKVETLGTEEEIEKKHGCPDGLEWAKAYVARLNEEERLGKEEVRIDLSPSEPLESEAPKVIGGDLLLLPLYNRLGLPQVCEAIAGETRVQYDLNEILEALVVLRILCPCSKRGAYELNKRRIRRTTFALEDLYRALSLLSGHIDRIQAAVWEHSQKVVRRDTRVIYYDCTNYYFEIEDNDLESPDPSLPGRRAGQRRRGKSKEHRPNPIVQMGMLMDGDGIPLAFCIFPGNESEQPSLQKIEEMVAERFKLNEFIISTDAGLSSEDNRRYNMTEGREYIAVQSLPSLPAADQAMALAPEGWRVAFRGPGLSGPVDPDRPDADTFSLDKINLEQERHTRFYKEIIVEKTQRLPNPEYDLQQKAQDTDKPVDANGKRIPKTRSYTRSERVIVTYSHDFALFLSHKRDERVRLAQKIVSRKAVDSRQSQQDPRRYVQATYCTADGEVAEHVVLHINTEFIEQEARFDGFYAYGTSLDDDAVDVLRARSFHHEIEHLFRTTKSHLDARPVYLSRQDRIQSHFLVCFLSMVIIKMLQKQLDMPDLSIDRLIDTLRSIEFDHFKGRGYRPLYGANALIEKLQTLADINICTQIVPQKTMNKYYRAVLKQVK